MSGRHTPGFILDLDPADWEVIEIAELPPAAPSYASDLPAGLCAALHAFEGLAAALRDAGAILARWMRTQRMPYADARGGSDHRPDPHHAHLLDQAPRSSRRPRRQFDLAKKRDRAARKLWKPRC